MAAEIAGAPAPAADASERLEGESLAAYGARLQQQRRRGRSIRPTALPDVDPSTFTLAQQGQAMALSMLASGRLRRPR
jgi:hypothetical protein